jgi:hypothetical protein
MPAWFAIAAPYIPEIIKIARPLFTRNSAKEKSIEVVTQQIAELQTSAIQNAESIKIIASEMQHTIEALQSGAAILEKKLELARILLVISLTVSVLAFCVAVYALSH